MLKYALTLFLVVAALYFYDVPIEKSIFAGFLVTICARTTIFRRIYENICIVLIITKIAIPNIENIFSLFINKYI